MPDTTAIAEAYARDGFVFPIDAMDAAQAAALRAHIEGLAAAPPACVPANFHADLYMRTDMHATLPAIHDLVADPRILDAVEAVLRPDLMVWGCSLFIKEPRSPQHVSWYQDLHYWGLDGVDEVTAGVTSVTATPSKT